MNPPRLLGPVLRLLERMGVRVNPFFVVEEGRQPIELALDNPHITLSLAGVSDIDQLLLLQKDHTRASLQRWFMEGKLCFVARFDNRLGALMWADLETFNYPPNFTRLENDEAYLFAAIAAPDLRGMNIAPSLRAYCYKTLRKQGIRKFYSYTDYMNAAARRFKAKLNAQETALRVYVDLWGRWQKTFTIKTYG